MCAIAGRRCVRALVDVSFALSAFSVEELLRFYAALPKAFGSIVVRALYAVRRVPRCVRSHIRAVAGSVAFETRLQSYHISVSFGTREIRRRANLRRDVRECGHLCRWYSQKLLAVVRSVYSPGLVCSCGSNSRPSAEQPYGGLVSVTGCPAFAIIGGGPAMESIGSVIVAADSSELAHALLEYGTCCQAVRELCSLSRSFFFFLCVFICRFAAGHLIIWTVSFTIC